MHLASKLPKKVVNINTSSEARRPWTEQRCQSALYPDHHLTFSWGEPVRPTRLYRILDMGIRKVQTLKRAGYGNFPLPDHRYHAAYIEHIRMALVAQHRRQKSGSREFTLNDLLASIELLELCSLARKEYQEMWAYVFADNVQIGYLYISRGDIDVSSDHRNATSDRASS